jgi:hypothetical protein
MAPSLLIRSCALISVLPLSLFAQGWEPGMRAARVMGQGLTFVKSVLLYEK